MEDVKAKIEQENICQPTIGNQNPIERGHKRKLIAKQKRWSDQR
jgi:hypothetical protein